MFDAGNAGTQAIRPASTPAGEDSPAPLNPPRPPAFCAAGGSYDLNLQQPYERSVALELLRMASERPGVALSRVTHVQGRKRTPVTLERLPGPPQCPPSPYPRAPHLSHRRRASEQRGPPGAAHLPSSPGRTRRAPPSPQAEAGSTTEAPTSPCVFPLPLPSPSPRIASPAAHTTGRRRMSGASSGFGLVDGWESGSIFSRGSGSAASESEASDAERGDGQEAHGSHPKPTHTARGGVWVGVGEAVRASQPDRPTTALSFPPPQRATLWIWVFSPRPARPKRGSRRAQAGSSSSPPSAGRRPH